MTTDGIQNRFSRAEIAEALEISGNQILQYQERGLLADRSANAQDIAYNSLDIVRLRFILRCEAAGYHGNDVVDFIGTVNKGANIKEQLKASLVHAHQKFSYVNAQKRKADILEKVNLQADADLIQKYIDEMKEIVANPKKPPISISPIKQKPAVSKRRPAEPVDEELTEYKDTDSEQATRYQPNADRLSRIRAGLERSQRFASESEPEQPEPPPAPVQPKPANRPIRTPSYNDRSKFIDSSSTSDDYGRRSSNRPDMFTDYSRPIRKKSTAWKQTLVTFLLLSAFSLAGYAFYVLKYQKPANRLVDLLEETMLTESDDQNNSDDLFTEQSEKPLSSTEKAPQNSKEKDPEQTIEETPAKPVEEIKPQPPKKPESKPQVQPQREQQVPSETVSPKPREIPQSTSATTADSTEKESASTKPTPSLPQTPDRTESLSEVAPKDIDDLIAQKQKNFQQPTDTYAPSDRPQVAVYDFKLFYQRSRKILIAKFKMARIRPQRNLIQGRLFVVFKPRQSAQHSNYFAIPDVRIADGIPAEPFKGIEFAFSESTKVQSVRSIYVRDPSQFDIATIFVFSKAGELVLRKDFSVSITEY